VISRPTTAQLIGIVRRELVETVAPAVDDPVVAGSLMMIDHILETLAQRAEHEIAWMLEEIDQIRDLAQRVANTQPDAAGVTEPLEHELASMHLSDVVEHYSVVSEALSRALEATLGTSSGLEATAVDLMRARLAHEQEVIGDFRLVGRG
jgi:hypothetical protein